MDHIVLTGVRPYDGRYPFDLEETPFTTLEWGWIKRMADHFPLTIADGWRNGDAELTTVFAIIAMHRAGKITERDVPDVWERLKQVPYETAIQLEPDTAEGDDAAGPPPASSSSNGDTSGDDSPTSSERSARPIPPATGIPASATSASAPATSAR